MPEHLRALVVILAFAAAVFALAGAPARAMASAPGEFERRRNLWFWLTLAAFLAHNFWVFALLAALLLHFSALKDQNKAGLMFFALIVLPPIGAEIPGFAGIRYFFNLNYIRLLCLVVLLPALFREVGRTSLGHFFSEWPDKLLAMFLVLNLSLRALDDDMTTLLRHGMLQFLDVAVPYAAASRLIGNIPQLRSAIAGYVLCAAILGLVGAFEFARGWLLYSTLDEALGLQAGFGNYILRGERVRAVGTAGQANSFGYTMAVGFVLLLSLRRYFPHKSVWLLALSVLSVGMIASYSRGCWVGAAAGLVVYCLTGPEKGRNLGYLVFGAVLAAVLVFATPLGEELVLRTTTIDTSTIDYRERLIANSLETIAANPWFGSNYYHLSAAMQEMIQGQGIIDIVNVPISVALRNGLVGLALFTGFFAAALFGLWRRMGSLQDKAGEEHDLGRGLLAALSCALVTILTTSAISFVPVIYHMLAGMAVSYAMLGRPSPRAAASRSRPPLRARRA